MNIGPKFVMLAFAFVACAILLYQCVSGLINSDDDAELCNSINWAGIPFFATIGVAILFEMVGIYHASD